MNYTIEDLISGIEKLPDNGKTDPRIGLQRLREYCIWAMDSMAPEDSFMDEQQKLRSTVWVIEQVTGSEPGFDRWLLFILRSKKSACANVLRKFSGKEKTRIAA